MTENLRVDAHAAERKKSPDGDQRRRQSVAVSAPLRSALGARPPDEQRPLMSEGLRGADAGLPALFRIFVAGT